MLTLWAAETCKSDRPPSKAIVLLNHVLCFWQTLMYSSGRMKGCVSALFPGQVRFLWVSNGLHSPPRPPLGGQGWSSCGLPGRHGLPARRGRRGFFRGRRRPGRAAPAPNEGAPGRHVLGQQDQQVMTQTLHGCKCYALHGPLLEGAGDQWNHQFDRARCVCVRVWGENLRELVHRRCCFMDL